MIGRVVRATGGAALLAIAGGRALEGVPAGLAYRGGYPAALAARFDEALPLVARAEVGAIAVEAAWLQGEIRLGLWDALDPARRGGIEGRALLESAAGDYLRAARGVPGAGFPLAGLAAVHDRAERAARTGRAFDLGRIGDGPWAVVGRDGRTALGLLARALDREPMVVALHDQYVTTLLAYGLTGEARAAIAAAARALPVYDEHRGLDFNGLAPDLVDAFAAAAREALGHAPMLPRAKHLLALGRLARRDRHFEQAIVDFEAATHEPADALQRAEIAYHQALAFEDLGRARKAEEAYDRAARVRVFRAPAALGRSRIAEREGRLDEALGWAQKAEAAAPERVEIAFLVGRLARLAERWTVAEEAYRRAAIATRDDPRALVGLVETAVESGDARAARRHLQRLSRIPGGDEEAARLREAHAALRDEEERR